MWNDEDNNPYGDDFDRRDSFTSSIDNASPSSQCACLFISLLLLTNCNHARGHSPQLVSI